MPEEEEEDEETGGMKEGSPSGAVGGTILEFEVMNENPVASTAPAVAGA